MISVLIFASYMRSFTRKPKVGIALGLLANMSAYLGLKTLSKVGFVGVLLNFKAYCNERRHLRLYR